MPQTKIGDTVTYDGRVLLVEKYAIEGLEHACWGCYFRNNMCTNTRRPEPCCKEMGRTIDKEFIVFKYIKDEPKIVKLDLTE